LWLTETFVTLRNICGGGQESALKPPPLAALRRYGTIRCRSGQLTKLNYLIFFINSLSFFSISLRNILQKQLTLLLIVSQVHLAFYNLLFVLIRFSG
jgi:hypothetical protein